VVICESARVVHQRLQAAPGEVGGQRVAPLPAHDELVYDFTTGFPMILDPSSWCCASWDTPSSTRHPGPPDSELPVDGSDLG